VNKYLRNLKVMNGMYIIFLHYNSRLGDVDFAFGEIIAFEVQNSIIYLFIYSHK
jgi:hypothetical protein